jgi:prepilin-type N-terminal cleavage/methylation domain-containing protein
LVPSLPEVKSNSMIEAKHREERIKGRVCRAGFTLIELLTVIAIMGVLTSVATVSFQGARASARDAKRLADTRQIQTALELYLDTNGGYPGDDSPGQAGLVLGIDRTATLSDAGFAPRERGNLYMARVPGNVIPNGLPFTYRSLNADGSDCDQSACHSYALIFALERETQGVSAGAHAVTPLGIAGPDNSVVAGVVYAGRIVGIESVQGSIGFFVDQATETLVNFVENKSVKTVAETAVAPAATVAALANAAVAVNTVAGAAGVSQYLFFFITQPLLLFRKRRRKFWGTVYNSLSRLPEDLVIVRLLDLGSGRMVQSEVTDRDGRFTFLVPAGSYRIEAVKGGFVFPSRLTEGKTEDGPFLDVYHGQEIRVRSGGASLTPNIPLDPEAAEVPDESVIRSDRRNRLQGNVALISPVLGALALAIKPSGFTLALFILQVMLYLFFRRIAIPDKPKNWGVVYEDGTGNPVYQAVTRIFAIPYHKLLETKVTDRAGRYNFRVGSNKYYVTVTKGGFLKTETEHIDFSDADKPMFIAADLPLRRVGYIVAGTRKGQVKDDGTAGPSAAPGESLKSEAGDGSQSETRESAKPAVQAAPSVSPPIPTPRPPGIAGGGLGGTDVAAGGDLIDLEDIAPVLSRTGEHKADLGASYRPWVQPSRPSPDEEKPAAHEENHGAGDSTDPDDIISK